MAGWRALSSECSHTGGPRCEQPKHAAYEWDSCMMSPPAYVWSRALAMVDIYPTSAPGQLVHSGSYLYHQILVQHQSEVRLIEGTRSRPT